MCTGMEIIAALGAGASVASGIKSLTAKAPQAVQQSPMADQGAIDAKAQAAASAQQLAQRRAARANSLLSSAGAAGDAATAPVMGKSALGQ